MNYYNLKIEYDVLNVWKGWSGRELMKVMEFVFDIIKYEKWIIQIINYMIILIINIIITKDLIMSLFKIKCKNKYAKTIFEYSFNSATI